MTRGGLRPRYHPTASNNGDVQNSHAAARVGGIYRVNAKARTSLSDFDRHWAAYAPDEAMPWNLRRVVHLHRRAGFAATWGEIQRDLKEGPAASVQRLIEGKAEIPPLPGGPPKSGEFDFAAMANLLADSAVAASEPGRLKAWWVFRMFFGPDPLGEKLTLLWHDHFATGNAKVQDLGAMRKQNDLFRKHARAPFADLLDAAVHDPALMIYLDAPANRKGHANENLARELMELFTLGIGHYSEADVKDAARALTGWTINDGAFLNNAKVHDEGDKTILGKKGKWTGDDLVKMLLDHPATSERLAFKLVGLFFGENGAPIEARKSLAAGLRERKLDIGWAVGVILRSKAFYSDSNIGTKILGPVDFVIGSERALELFDDPPSTLAVADWCGRLGQDLFEPPNVGGWPAGKAWVSARTLIGRANYITALLDGPNAGRKKPFDAVKFARDRGYESLPQFYSQLLLGTDPPAGLRDKLVKAEGRKLVGMLLAAPEAQLG
jgi:Protein of unknown function (DUF1800)